MADPDPDPSFGDARESYGESDTGGQSAPNFAPDHDSDTPQPRPGEGDRIVRPEDLRRQHEQIYEALNNNLIQQRVNQNNEYILGQQLQDIKEDAAKQAQLKPPTPYALPAPPDQNQKNQIAVAATNILKIGALFGLAYGLNRRSPRRSALFKTGLASALESYHSGDNYSRDQSLKLWEANTKFIMDENRLQHQQFIDTKNLEATTLRQKFDIWSKQAEMWNNHRAWDASIRQNMMDLDKSTNEEIKMQRDIETQTRNARKTFYDAMGLKGWEGIKYANWIKNQGGPDIRKFLEAEDNGIPLSDEEKDKFYQIESRYPRDKMLEQEQAAKDKREEEKKAKEAEDAEKRGFGRELELSKQKSLYEYQLKAGEIDPKTGKPIETLDPNAPISDDKRKEMMDKIFSAGD